MRPLCAGHSPHLIPCSLTGAGTEAVPNPIAGAAVPVLAGLRARRLAGVVPAKSQRLHPPPVPWLLAAQGFSGVLPPGRVEVGVMWWGLCRACGIPVGGVSVGGIGAAHAAARPSSRRGAEEVEWGSHVFECPKGTGSALAWPPALCFPTPPLPSQSWGQSWELQRVFSPAMGAEGMCPWQGGTGAGTLGMGTLSPALGATVFPDCHTACPGHHTKGRGGTMLVVWGTGDMADVGSGSASLCLSPAVF